MEEVVPILCSDISLAGILSIIKRILLLIQVIVPILLIVMASIHLIQLVRKPDDQKQKKKVVNSFLAAAVVFLIPSFANVMMGMLGEDYHFSSCWNHANDFVSSSDKYYEFDDTKSLQTILTDPDSYEKGMVGMSKLDYSRAVEIPNSVLKNASRSNLSIVIVGDDGHVYAAREPDLLREGGSTYKVFTGYAAVNLLDPKTDVVVATKYAQNMPYMGTPDVKIGQKFTVSQAATRDFPGSSNITTANIAITIGKKHAGATSDKDAYFKGMELINAFIKESGCTKSVLQSSSGVNYNYNTGKFVGNQNGISRSIYGITANDLALVTINAMKDENFSKGINYGRNGICPPPDSNSFFIKSGTQAYCHGVWGFNYQNKRYYIAILGVNCNKGDNKCTIFKDLYNWSRTSLLS